VRHSDSAVHWRKRTRGMYFCCFFLRYFCLEKSVLVSHVSLFSTSFWMISRPLAPLSRSSTISVIDSFCAELVSV